MNCVVCEQGLSLTWTDTHGVAACLNCGAPYRVFHYENDVRVEKPAELALDETGKAMALRYWQEAGRKVFPGCYDMGLTRGGATTYSGATQDEIESFNDWYLKQPEKAVGEQT